MAHCAIGCIGGTGGTRGTGARGIGAGGNGAGGTGGIGHAPPLPEHCAGVPGFALPCADLPGGEGSFPKP